MSDSNYQNVIIRSPVPGPRLFKPAPKLPVSGEERQSSQGCKGNSNVSNNRMLFCPEDRFSLARFNGVSSASASSLEEEDDATKHGTVDSDLVDFPSPSSIYNVLPSRLCKSSDNYSNVPPIPPRKQILMSSDQQDLFNWIPPPHSASPAPAIRIMTPTSACSSLPRQSLSLSPTLADSVPLLRPPERNAGSSPGYVPHEPGLVLPLSDNGYLKMTKQDSVVDCATKPPFADLLRPNDQVCDADDREYYSMSELYMDEPLYQVYHKGAVVRDVIEQALDDEDNDVEYEDYEDFLTTVLQRTSKKRSAETGIPAVLTTIENLIPSVPGSRKLWADTPQVKNSRILEGLSSQEKKHQECIFEIISSEASYLKSLKLLETHFMEDPRLKPPESALLSKTDFQHLFSNVKSIIAVSNRMLQELEFIWRHSIILDAGVVCQALKKVAEQHYGVYVPYLTNAAFQERKLSELNYKLEFRNIVVDLEDAPEVNGLKLQSFLVLPMQRITRIPLLIYAVLQGIEAEESVVDEINDCLNTFQTILNECNERARQMENLQQLHDLSRQLKFKKTSRMVPIVSQTRYLIKKGSLVQIKPVSRLPIQMTKRLLKTVQKKVLKEKTTRYFFLFNDLLLISKKKGNHCFEVIESSERRNLSADIIDDRNIHNYLPAGSPVGCNFLFCLAILGEENSELILSCDSENERMRWIEACCPSSQNGDEDERIYELNDCPQVQAVQRFVADEPDELGLEESDIVNVLKKTTDGWYEGERIRDGRRGWFLASHTVEIESAHRRAKNRRQRWILLKQTEKFQDHRLN